MTLTIDPAAGLVIAILYTVAGTLMLVFRRPLLRHIVDTRRRNQSLTGIPPQPKLQAVLIVIVGIAFVATGVVVAALAIRQLTG